MAYSWHHHDVRYASRKRHAIALYPFLTGFIAVSAFSVQSSAPATLSFASPLGWGSDNFYDNPLFFYRRFILAKFEFFFLR